MRLPSRSCDKHQAHTDGAEERQRYALQEGTQFSHAKHRDGKNNIITSTQEGFLRGTWG